MIESKREGIDDWPHQKCGIMKNLHLNQQQTVLKKELLSTPIQILRSKFEGVRWSVFSYENYNHRTIQRKLDSEYRGINEKCIIKNFAITYTPWSDSIVLRNALRSLFE